ncbi:MAG: UDP-3-O-acyl-N-acetylglucosamine deacetylase [Micavibrio sp.]|nr:MAG: UDP-3-O-acyl-N-acetylglucosamine deacetylase [Micavibrio sp.]
MGAYITQNTLRRAVSCEGVGVHSGIPTTLTVKPAPENSGFVFVRTDVTDKDNRIPATWDNVCDTQLCTVLANEDGVKISTVEHVLSALWGCGIDNAVIEVSGGEIPIMDGSAADFVTLLRRAGIATQDAPRKFLAVKAPVTVVKDDKKVTLRPAATQSFYFEIDFDSKAIGRQQHEFHFSESGYEKEIGDARTFGFLHEVEALRRMGLARGGSLDNAVVIDGDTVLNSGGLRHKNEFVRHKILDALGDLLLCGGQIIGRYEGIRAGHHMNNEILRKLFATKDAWEFITLTKQQYLALAATGENLRRIPATAPFVVISKKAAEQNAGAY